MTCDLWQGWPVSRSVRLCLHHTDLKDDMPPLLRPITLLLILLLLLLLPLLLQLFCIALLQLLLLLLLLVVLQSYGLPSWRYPIMHFSFLCWSNGLDSLDLTISMHLCGMTLRMKWATEFQFSLSHFPLAVERGIWVEHGDVVLSSTSFIRFCPHANDILQTTRGMARLYLVCMHNIENQCQVKLLYSTGNNDRQRPGLFHTRFQDNVRFTTLP